MLRRIYYTLRRWIFGEWHQLFVNDDLVCEVKSRRKAIVFEFEQPVLWDSPNVVRVESPRYSAATITVNYVAPALRPIDNMDIQVRMDRP
jgi:hypothetical protein